MSSRFTVFFLIILLFPIQVFAQPSEITSHQTAGGKVTSLFSPETKEMLNRPVCDFIERMTSEIIAMKDASQAENYLKRNKIQIIWNGVQYGQDDFRLLGKVIDVIGMPSSFSLVNEDGYFHATILYGFLNKLEYFFPASRELIFGTDKKESDEEINEMLVTDAGRRYPLPEVQYEKAECSYDDSTGLYLLRGDRFMIDAVSRNIWCAETEGLGLRPVVAEEHLPESARNIMLGVAGYDPQLHIRHRMYGECTPDFNIYLSKLLMSFTEDFNTYSGAQYIEDGAVQCVLLFHNYTYNYIHMLVCTMREKDLASIRDRVIDADFFSNIPQHYVKNLFK